MSSDSPTTQTDRANRFWRLAALAAAVALVVVLAINARSTTMFDDEAHGLLLAGTSFGEMVELLRGNYSEDPPLWDVLLHPWFRLVGLYQGRLRLLPLCLFAAALPGVLLAVRRLAGERAACCAVIALCLMPYHWLLPMAIRWYSLYACLAVWNFFFYLRMEELARPDASGEEASKRRRLLRALPYALTGACMWYANYTAPALFFTHLIVAVGRAERRRQLLLDLALSWTAIAVLFLPWLPTFLRQLGSSTRPLSVPYAGYSLWVLAAGEFSTPMNLWIAVPAAGACLLLAILCVARFRRCWAPLAVVTVGMAALLATGAIGPKRLLMLSPFLAMVLGIVLGAPSPGRRWVTTLRAGLAAAALAVVVGSLVQMIRRDGWGGYRWIDPCRQVVEQLDEQTPPPLVISESKPIFFYAQAIYGQSLCALTPPQDPAVPPRAILSPLKIDRWRDWEDVLRRSERVAWVYHSSYRGPISKYYEEMTQEMAGYGFRVTGTKAHLPVSPSVLKFHPRYQQRTDDPLDAHRVVLVYFEK